MLEQAWAQMAAALGVRVLALEVVGAQVASVPVEARKQSRATLPLLWAAEHHHHHPQVAEAEAQELVPVVARAAEKVVAPEVVQAVGTEAAQV